MRYISMELYHRIVNEVEKVSPKFASRIQTNNGRYIYRPKDMQSGRWSVDIVLRTNRYKLFFGTLALPKNRGACVDAQKWHVYKEWLEAMSRLIQTYY